MGVAKARDCKGFSETVEAFPKPSTEYGRVSLCMTVLGFGFQHLGVSVNKRPEYLPKATFKVLTKI